MTTDNRTTKLGRISLKLQQVSRELPDPRKAAFFLRNAVRLTRIIHHKPAFQSQPPMICPNCGSLDGIYLDRELYCEGCRISYVVKEGGLEAI